MNSSGKHIIGRRILSSTKIKEIRVGAQFLPLLNPLVVVVQDLSSNKRGTMYILGVLSHIKNTNSQNIQRKALVIQTTIYLSETEDLEELQWK